VNGTWNVFALNNVHNPSDHGTNTAGWEFYMDNVLKNAWAYYPTAGSRSVGSGVMSYERGIAYYWSSTPSNSTHGHHLLFHSTDVLVQYSNPRGYGFSVRCVQE
jgi:uncharacterized protein (TIGR02145 family)